jgi:site-specific recombinase XerD
MPTNLENTLAALPAGWAEPVTSWTDQLLAKGTAETTATGYALHVGWLARDLLALAPEPWQITPAVLSAWLDAHTWAAITRRKVVGSLRSFYTWAMLEGRCQRSPLAGIASVPRRVSGPAPLPVHHAWQEPVEQWCIWQRASAVADGTIRLRRFWMRRLAETYADPWTVTADDLALFLSRDDWAPETKRGGRSAIRGFYRWAEQAGHVSTSPARDLTPVRLPRTVPRPAPDDAVAVALAHADDRTRLVIALAVYAGLRRAEIAAAHATDVGTESLRVSGKGGHERLVPLHPELARMLRTELRRRREGLPATGWPRHPDPDGWLFPSTQPENHLTAGAIGKMLDRVLPTGWTPHTLRHRFATQAYASGRDLRAVQELLGHASPTTTIRYAAVPSDALVNAVQGVTLPIANLAR